jgi:hypothetical protein
LHDASSAPAPAIVVLSRHACFGAKVSDRRANLYALFLYLIEDGAVFEDLRPFYNQNISKNTSCHLFSS